MTGLPDDKLREHLYDAVERVLAYDTETIEIVWKFNEAKIDTDENIGVAKRLRCFISGQNCRICS